MAVTTNFSFLKLVGADSAGYTTINSLIDSIDTILNARIPASATAMSVIGRASLTSGATADIAATVDGHMLQRTSGGLGWSSYAGHRVAANLAARPASPFAGEMIYQTDTDELLKYVVDLDGTSRWMQAEASPRRNFVINGGFDVWQRGTSFNPTSSSTLSRANYGADRWQFCQATTSAAAFTQQPIGNSDPAGYNYYTRVQRVAAATLVTPYIIQTSFESQNLRNVRGKYLTLSFWARAGANYSAASSFLTSQIVRGTGVDNTVDNFTSDTPISLTEHVLTTSWKRFTTTTTAVVPTTTNQLGVKFKFEPVGTAGAADYFDITGVQLEVGSAPSDFEFRDAGEELARCQRYYYSVKPSASYKQIGLGFNLNTTTHICTLQFPTTLRSASPTFSTSSSASDFVVQDFAGERLCTVVPVNSTGTYVATTDVSASVTFTTGASLTTGQAARAAIRDAGSSPNVFIAYSAEL